MEELSAEKLAATNRIHIAPILLGYIIYVIFLSMTDLLALPLYYLDANRFLPVAIGLAAALTVLLVVRTRKYISIETLRLQKSWLVYGGILLAIAFLRGLAPDLSHDVSMARVFWQYPGFADNISYNVFPAGFTFFFPLSDRIFYYPRLLLGCRLGMLMNAFLLILIYRQVWDLLHRLVGSRLEEIRTAYAERAVQQPLIGILNYLISEEFLAFMAVTLYYSLADLGTYMIDLVAIPLLLWLVKRVLDGRRHDAAVAELIFVAVLCGLCFALKFTNVIFVAPLLLIYLWQNRKAIHPGIFCLCLLLGLLPSVPYLLYAYTSTGNPVFWTFNSIFKSPYYPDTDFKDTRWGPQNWKDFLLWPFHLIFNYSENVAEISFLPQVYLLFGYVGAGCAALRYRKHKEEKPLLLVAAVFMIFTLFWLKSTGYPRYAILCEILALLLAAAWLISFLESKKRWKRAVAVLSLLVLFAQCMVNTGAAALNLYDWSFRERIVSTSAITSYYRLNAAELFTDRGLIGTEEQRERVDVFLSTHIRHSMMKVLDPDAAIVNGSYIVNYLLALKDEKGIDYVSYYFGKLKEEEANGARIYDMAIAGEYDSFCDSANSVGAEIISLEEVDGYFVGKDTPILIGYSMTGKENTCTDLSTQPSFEIPAGSAAVHISGIACLPSYVQWDAVNPIVQICISAAGESVALLTLEIPQHEYIQIDQLLDVSQYTQSGSATLSISDVSEQSIAGNIFNLEVLPQ
ncbi:hypothetical protein [Oscillibacter sp.]|uniref:hypothetical protein n=1 Tax=Oscillibacter sp. TaxID=1945593 RepID=UPI002623A794|nr:hypothetical protein [Oscillibacter sp.]MDD3346471.1 hypothetical protein [Oscillibacter sp.]